MNWDLLLKNLFNPAHFSSGLNCRSVKKVTRSSEKLLKVYLTYLFSIGFKADKNYLTVI
jgi:hypothetical protein